MCPLTPARWRRIEQILDEAFELEPDERAPFVDRACAGEPELRAEVRGLVAADRSAGAFLEPPITPGVAVLVGGGGNDPGAPESASAGERIGPYRVVRELGHGGMGAVYLAERADGQFEQRVALKLIRRDMTGDEVRRRFLQERQILAGLQHANIARLLDGGITSDGRPYFVMEHVEGVPITRYCDEHRLAVEGRLALFGRVCDAVRHAHERHVVHRDLKPANILVTATGELKLLDFGIAKPLDDVPGHHAAAQTRAGLHVMTPEYAAPEQIRLQPATAATDVYALGVVLYELLSGHPPYRVAGHSPAAVERVVCEQEPTRPSRMVGRAEDLRHADGRIEAITAETVSEARGTRPERLRRLLSGDLDHIVLRAMAKEPTQRYASVEALREDLARYLAGRPVLAWRGTAAYRVSRFARRRVTAMGMAAFAALVLAAIAVVARPAPPGGAMPTSGAAPSDRPLRLDPTAIPAVARGLYEEGFRAYHQQDMHSARRLFRAALAEDSSLAVAAYYTLTIELGMGLPPDSGLEARLRRLVNRLPEPEGLLVRGRIASGTLDPALLAVAETLTTRYPSEAEGHLLLGRALLTRGDLLRALPRLRRVVAMDSLGLRGRTADCHACDALAAIVSAYIHADSLPAAERTARDWVRAQPTSGQAWHHLALALELQGEREEALAAIRRAAPLKPGNPYVPIYPALLDIRLGSFEAADRLLREQVRAGPPSVQTEALWFLTISLRYQGRVREALATARALRRLRPDMSEPRMAEAQVLFEMGRPREAAALFDSLAAEPGRGELGRVPSAVAMRRSWHLTHAADARTVAGDTAGLWPLADTIEALGAQTLSGQRRRLHHHVRGLLHAARGDTAQAVREFYRATFRPIAPSSGFTRTDLELARGLLALGRPEEAVRALQPALRGSLEAAAFYLTYTELHALLGRAFEATGQADSARAHYRRVLDAWKDADPAFHARRDTVRLRLAALGR